ncbi:DUF92 domain-containing protein [Paenibacillus sp.]|jgi:uncharacterized protein (TIGR00297 family)|uniref:DUF92 domain-containing protein n=1 Tax=Paenibacillus sp. TaxID=58172 RepID=UPI0028316582|nr:DUF92 domain-containing protein [Paenibacillus sp.]MDR0270607.1 DUF92 domain-containing protein [Paenibacillus sp.]
MFWLIGAFCALVVGGAAYLKRSLTLSGAAAAFVMGTVYFGAGNLLWFGILLVFFVSSSLLSKFKQTNKEELEKSYAKTSTRDAGQVLANGGAGMLLCILNALWPHPGWIYAFIGVMAAVTADTWATEWGGLSRRLPRSVVTGKIVPPGTSGGVTLLGSTAAALGGLMIALFGWLFAALSGMGGQGLGFLLAGVIGGLAGAFADSFLGATLQVMHRCQVCGKDVEVLTHCGQSTRRIRGLSWMNNDAVNFLSSCIGGVAAWLLTA